LGYLEIYTDSGMKGVGWSFTNGQGNDVLVTAIQSLARRLKNRKLSDFTQNMAETQRKMCGGQIRFMSPERGVLQLASCAVLNALWDLWVSCGKQRAASNDVLVGNANA
jgi:L-alanine-DL-glutamate epimerase-like enolase superfamily enzyme